MPIYLLLAMQAAGMVFDFLGTKQQEQFYKMGQQLQGAALDSNLAQVKLEAEEGSLMGLNNLRQTLGTQIAVMAARGTSTAGGSAVSLLNESQGNFNADERVRRLNQMGKENQLRSSKVMSMLDSQSKTSQLWQGFASRTINRFPSSFSSFSGSSGGAFSGSSAGSGGNFGLTNI